MSQPLRVGVAGLGDAGSQVVTAVPGTPGFVLAAVADTRQEAVRGCMDAHGVRGFESVEAMCESRDVDVVYVATPNKFHVPHTLAAIESGRHVIVVKPLALTLADCDSLIDAADKKGVKLVYGHSRIYDPPVEAMAKIVRAGELGRLIQINTWMYGGWLQRKPRLASELATDAGGGVVYRQAPHQADIVRSIGGGKVRSLRALAGRWDPNFPDTEGNYTAYVEFDNGTPATLVMNGYGYFSTSELTHGLEPSKATTGDRYTQAADAETKYAQREKREYYYASSERASQPFYGLTVVSCERGDIRQSRDGLYIYTSDGKKDIACDSYPGQGRASVTGALVALGDALAGKRQHYPDGRWAKATLELCLAILESHQKRCEILLSHQVPSPW